jgi:hypothetical protein
MQFLHDKEVKKMGKAAFFFEKLWEGLLITVFVIAMTFLILILLCKSCF